MSENYSIKKVISKIKNELKDIYPKEEIESFIFLIFEHVLGLSRTKLLTSYDDEFPNDKYAKIENFIADLKNSKPIQHIIGETSFYNLIFKVNSNVLIPRPETEELVDWIIKDHKGDSKSILDIGTGSACIAIALSKNLKKSKVFALDISEKALDIARENSKLNHVDITFLKFDILNEGHMLKDKFDIIVSNPPYITEKEKKLMQKNVLNYEPELALFVPDEDPLRFYKAIINFAQNHLNPNGEVYFEINEAFGKEMMNIFNEDLFSEVLLKKDINGKDRMIKAILK